MTCHRMLFLAALGLLVACGKPPAAPVKPPVPVETALAGIRDVPIRLSGVGTTAASELVTVRPQVTAMLAKVLFNEGDTVAAGAPLFQLDDRSFSAAASQAQADAERARAQLALAESEAVRSADLLKQGLISTQQDEQARSALAVAKAAHAAANAALVRTRLELSWCTVTAPIAGRTGATGITAGNLAAAGQTALVAIARMQPMRVSFTLPAKELTRVRAAHGAAPLAVSVLPDGGEAPEDGVLDLIDNQVDATTATIRLRAACPNPKDRLWPGQQCRVDLILGLEKGVVTVPTRAVQTGQRGALVWVVGKDRAAEPRLVEVARSGDGLSVIAKGLAGGETVVVDGQLRLSKGAVVADAAAKPAGKPAEKPAK